MQWNNVKLQDGIDYFFRLFRYKHPSFSLGIYTRCQCAQVVGKGICSSVVEHWSSNSEDAGSIPTRKTLQLHFLQLVPVWVL